MRILKTIASGVALSALLAGCATTEANLHNREAARVAGDLREISRQPAAPADTSPIQVRPAAYVGANVTRNLNGDPLPTRWRDENVQFARAGAVSFQDVASMITEVTGIPVAVASFDGASANAGIPQGGSADFTSGGGIADGPIPVDFPLGEALGQIAGGNPGVVSVSAAGGGNLGIPGTMRLNYSGKLRGLLDLVAANFNVGWEYRGGRLVFSRTVTRVFDVPALPVLANLSFEMTSNSQRAEGGNTAGQSASTSGQYDLWTELNQTIASIVGSSGTYQTAAQAGQVIVNAPPTTVDRVAEYLSQLNGQLEKQVAISVEVYSVALRDGDEYGSNIGALLQNAGGYSLDLLGGGPVPGATGFNWAILDGNGAFQGASGMVRALSTRGEVSTVTSASVTALNGVPVPVQVANSRGYVERIAVTEGDSGPTQEVTPGTVTTGFNLHLVPRVVSGGELLLQYGMNISELVGSDNGFRTFGPAGAEIELPEINQRNFIQQARVPNGATLVLAGYEQVRSTNSSSGPVSTGLWPFGGSRSASMSREIMVIAITPVILDTSARAQANHAQ